mgnify:CR=1 FL=1|tara:strand:+ start:75 stop:380 length:306 start_codon:yes stop_codon:yes gene_type:complete
MAWKKEQREYMDLVISVWKTKFQRYYNRWSEIYSDDRLIFCNVYNKVLESMEYMKKVNNLTIQVAMIEYYAKEEEYLREIVNYFTGQTQRNGTLKINPEAI